MKLYLVRHGIALDLSNKITSDFQRPLSSQGKEETELVACGLRRLGIQPDLMVASSLIRARQTAEVFMEVFQYKNDLLLCNGLTPGGLASDVYKTLNMVKNKEEIMLFGHEPDMMRLAQILLWAGPELAMPFKKAGVCRIDVVDIPPTSPGVLKWFLSPKIAKLMV